MSEKKNLDSTLTAFGYVRSAAMDTSRARGGLQDLFNETPTILENLTA